MAQAVAAPEALRDYARVLDEALLTGLEDLAPTRLKEACLHYPQAGGKRLRPAIALLACEAAGGAREDAVPLGVALELVHVFSLVHDDIMDQDNLRRGQPTVHAKWDEPTAILAGDTLLGKAVELLAEHGAPADRVKRLLLDLGTLVRVLCEGQMLDMAFEERHPDAVTRDEYLHMIYGKTARIYEVAARGGAILAGADEGTVRALEMYGKSFGMAFQLQDDLLDVLGTADTLGKTAGKDVRSGKKTLLLLEAWRRAHPDQREVLDRVVGNPEATPEDVEAVVDVYRATGALSEATLLVRMHTEEALLALETLPETPARRILAHLARWASGREQ